MTRSTVINPINALPPQIGSDADNQASLADAVFRLIWAEGAISRAQIARRLKLSRSTVTEIVRELLNSPFVAEGGRGKSSGGRRPIVLEFMYDTRIIAGIDIGATHVSVLLTNLRGDQLAFREEKHGVRADPDGTIALAIRLTKECVAEASVQESALLALGVAIASPVDPMDPMSLPKNVMPAWQGTNALERLGEQFDVPIYIDNDANLGALAEQWWGIGCHHNNIMFIKAGYGMGAGYILDGQVYRGYSGFAGEIGHMPLDPSGPTCVCGLRGCLGTLIGGRALENAAKEQLPNHPDSLLDPTRITYRRILQAARDGDPLSQSIVRDAARHLGQALAVFINLMNPELIIIGGGWSLGGETLITLLQEEVARCSFIQKASPVSIQLSTLGPRTVARGAATLAIKKTLLAPDMYQLKPT